MSLGRSWRVPAAAALPATAVPGLALSPISQFTARTGTRNPCFPPAVPHGALVLEHPLSQEHPFPAGVQGCSSPAEASAPTCLPRAAQGRSDGIWWVLFLPPLWGGGPSSQPASPGPQSPLLPGSFPKPSCGSAGLRVAGAWGSVLGTTPAICYSLSLCSNTLIGDTRVLGGSAGG